METRNLDEMTGASNYSNKRLTLDTLSINGDGDIKEVNGKYVPQGGYFRLALTSQQKKNEKPEEVKLGSEVKVVFLKIRRVLQERSGDKVIRWTNEHNTADDVVELGTSESKATEIASARNLREKYPNLRTIQIVYGLLLEDGKSPQKVKIRIKGASLGSEAKQDGVHTFYTYVASFDRANDEHLRNHVTILKAIKEESKKTYYCINFIKGTRLDETTQKIADSALIEMHDILSEQDKVRKEKFEKRKTPVAEGVDEIPSGQDDVQPIDYPEDEINPEDIPF